MACARGPATRDLAEIRRLAGGPVAWDGLCAAAEAHAVEPVLVRSLGAIAWEGVPTSIRDALTERARSIAEDNLAATGELLRVLDVLGSSGIEAVPYKGPVLAVQAYGDVALRRFVDLDVLVRRADVIATIDALHPEGYVRQQRVRAGLESWYFRSQNEFGLVHGEHGQILEIQWAVAPRSFAVDVDLTGLFDRSRPIRLGGRDVPAFEPADLLLLLCVHGAKHLWERLGWIVDVAELMVTHPDLDWDAARRRARAAGSFRMLLVGVGLARELLAASVPEPVVRAIAGDPAVGRLVDAFGARLADPSPHERRVRRLDLSMRERPIDRFRHLLLLAVTPTAGDINAVALPRHLFFLYYALRPFRLAWSMLRPAAEASDSG